MQKHQKIGARSITDEKRNKRELPQQKSHPKSPNKQKEEFVARIEIVGNEMDFGEGEEQKRALEKRGAQDKNLRLGRVEEG